MIVVLGLSAPLALAQEPELTKQNEQPLWTTQPTRIDPSRQHFERIPAKTVVRDSRNWLVVPQRIRVIDSTSFTAGETTYRLANIRPVKAKRLCQAIEGGRWACGRMAAIFLGNLVRGKRLLCDMKQEGEVMVLEGCVIGTRDVASQIVAQGYGQAETGEALLAAQAEAQKLAAKGLWRNAKCVADFDNC